MLDKLIRLFPYLNSMDAVVYIRNKILEFFYKLIFKNIFFLFDAESVHDFIIKFGKLLGSNPISKFKTKLLFNYENEILEQSVLGINFKNPVGLAAGFDKNGYLIDILPNVGFGFVEIGSITGEKCEGNEKPRLWRLKKSRALVVNYGLTNEGSERISERLKNKKCNIPLGISIAKTNSKECADTIKGIKDYVKATKKFSNIGDYFTINISCPNAFGGQPFHEKSKLDFLLNEIDKIETKKPIFLKISGDLSFKEIDDIISVSNKHKVNGFILINLTKKRDNKKILDKDIPEKGGISGKVEEDLSNKIIEYVYKKTKGRYVIIGVGGIFSAEDAYIKIKLGASLVQLITGMVYEGPQLISEINYGLVKLLKKDGFKNISEAVGVDSKIISKSSK